MSVYYTREHEWVRVEGDQATVGITDFAQGQLGDVVFVEVPEAGRAVTRGSEAAVVESVKAASDVYSPVSGRIRKVNEALTDKPETINEDAFGEGWIFVVEPASLAEVEDLLSPDDYVELIENDSH